MIVDDGADIALYHLSARADGKLHDVLDIRLCQLHPVGLTEAPRGTAPGFGIFLHLLFTEAGVVKISLQS